MLYELFFVFRGSSRLKEKFGVLFFVDGTRRIYHDVAAGIVLRESNEVADGIAAAK